MTDKLTARAMQIDGIGAGYDRTTDSWRFYSMPGAVELQLSLHGFDRDNLDFIIELLRRGLSDIQREGKGTQERGGN